ncbi:MAG: pantetheine-phosphate adenylyltransferase [Alphaproteobacteria bacterium]|nr:pantetheine-phosphate adenylyltransferase [Alphaproteobacteria bacterium]
MSAFRVGIYPGTFDPITNGHMDIISRAARHMVDKLIVGVAENIGKSPLFSAEERVEMVTTEIQSINGDTIIEVVTFNNLLTDFAVSSNATMLIRGLRAVSDFEYEFQMASMNSYLKPDIETVFLMASDKNQFISSGLVKEIAKLGGDIHQFVSPRVNKTLQSKISG